MRLNLIIFFFSDIKMSDHISTADEFEYLSDILSDVQISPRDSGSTSEHSSLRSPSESSSAHETSTDYNTG